MPTNFDYLCIMPTNFTYFAKKGCTCLHSCGSLAPPYWLLQMTTKLDQSSAEHRPAKFAAPSSLTPKISMFGAKAGFIIPKNKLAGSLVIRSTSDKNETPTASNEDSSRHVHRKTKWGPDLALDPVVCKGRALAYQVSYYHLSLFSFASMGLCF